MKLEIDKKKFVSFDLETTSLDYIESQIVGISLACDSKKAYYIPLLHEDQSKYKQLPKKFVLENLKPILETHKIKKVGHNLKYDRNVLRNYDIILNGIEHDSMLLSYVYDSTAIRHGLDNAAEKYLSHKTIHYEDIAGKGAKQIPFSKVDIETAAEYSCEDVLVSYELYNYLWAKVSKDENIIKVYKNIEKIIGDSQFYSWIYRIAINTAKNVISTKARTSEVYDNDTTDQLLSESATTSENPENILQAEQLRSEINKALQNLPEDIRVTLSLREFDGLSYEEIAKVLNCPIGTVRSRIHKGREMLDQTFSKYNLSNFEARKYE